MTDYPIIKNCNYESAEDDTIHRIRLAVDAGLTDDLDLLEAMTELEEVLTDLAEKADVRSVSTCRRAEQAVLRAWTVELRERVEVERISRYRD